MTDVSSMRTKISLRLLLGVALLTSACSATQTPVAQSPAATQSPTATTSLQSPIPTAQSSTVVPTSQAPVTQSSAATQSTTTAPSAPTQLPTTQASTEAPATTSTSADRRNYLGAKVPGPNPGSTVTLYDFRGPIYNELTDEGVAGINVKVCVGDLPEGTSQVTWAPWSLIGPDDARYSELEPAGGPDMSPLYPQVAPVSSGDCARGWITFAVPMDARISGIRYILGDDAGNFATTFRPLVPPAPGQTRPEGCLLISSPDDEAASALWLKPNQKFADGTDISIDHRASYADPEEHGTYYVGRTKYGTVLTWWWYDREYIERLNGPDAVNLPQPADAATFKVGQDFMKTGRLFRPSQGGAYDKAKQCVA